MDTEEWVEEMHTKAHEHVTQILPSHVEHIKRQIEQRAESGYITYEWKCDNWELVEQIARRFDGRSKRLQIRPLYDHDHDRTKKWRGEEIPIVIGLYFAWG